LHIIVTAGPTREYIDDVRFISNPSTGKMGYAVAAEAAKRGHTVTLLSGPTCLTAPRNVEMVYFQTVGELLALITDRLDTTDCLVMAAAPGDYRPAQRIVGKHKKAESLTLELVATQDILKTIAPRKGQRIHVGFAVEVADPLANARKKLESKSLDMLVLNAPESFGADKANFTLLFPDGEARPLVNARKTAVAAAILTEVEALFRGRKRS
jgi:phosphopantothenoylcysteine decarboxylase / phosphopantothenate---cysteine ligase